MSKGKNRNLYLKGKDCQQQASVKRGREKLSVWKRGEMNEVEMEKAIGLCLRRSQEPSINNIRKMFPAGMSRNLLALFVEIGNLSTLFTLVNISEIIVVYSIVLSRWIIE